MRIQTKNPRVAHIITDLNGFGGTEMTLLRYLKGSNIPRDCHRVIVLKSIGAGNTLGVQMVAAGFSVVELNQMKGAVSLSGLTKVYREINKFDPDVISGWSYYPSLLATIVAHSSRHRPPVVWHIRSLSVSIDALTKTPGRYIAQRVLALLSHVTQPLIASNSRTAMQQHVDLGFNAPDKRQIIIPNGIDLSEYFRDEQEGLAVRHELGIPADAVVIGSIGRFVLEKGYATLFSALRILQDGLPPEVARRIHFLGAGDGVSLNNSSFSRMALDSLSPSKLHLLDKRADVSRLLRALDIYVLPSINEAFPNSLVEAMATALPCIASDVGECRDVVASQDYVVPPSDPIHLAERIRELVELGRGRRSDLGHANRERIASQYELSKMVCSFDELFSGAAAL